MRGKAHTTISAFLCQAFAILVFRDITPIAFLIGGLFGLVADIDEEQSKISYLLIGKFGGSKKNVKDSFGERNKRHNKRVRFTRQLGLTGMLILISVVLYILLENIWFSMACLYIAIIPWTEHRTLSHSIFSSLIIGTCAYLGFNVYELGQIGIYCGVGYFLHVFEDSFTVSGTPLLYPFTKKKFKIPLMSTGTPKGNFVEFVFTVVSIGVLVASIFATIQ